MSKKLVCLILVICIIISACTNEQPKDNISIEPELTEAHTMEATGFTGIKQKELRVVIDGNVNIVEGYFVDNQYYFSEDTIVTLLGDINESAPVIIDGESRYSLKDTVEKMNLSSYVYDDVLDAIYIWKALEGSDGEAAGNWELDRAVTLGLGSASDEIITFAEYLAILDKLVEITDSTKFEEWQARLADARTSDKQMSRADGFLALFYAAETLGEDYMLYNADWLSLNFKIGEGWEMDYTLFPGIGEEVKLANDDPRPRDAIGYFYAMGRASLNSGKTLFDYDEERNSMRPYDNLTVNEALIAAVRLYDSTPMYVSLTDTEAQNYDKGIITESLLSQANAQPEVTLESIPYWTGFTYGYGYTNDLFTMMNEEDIRNISNWGFNNVRLILDFRNIVTEDVSQANLGALKQLDRIISYGMKYNVHIDILFIDMPGWWTEMGEDFHYYGSLDFFTNPEKQKQSQDMWKMLAKRYNEIPNSTLSFTPFFEALNATRSTGTDIVQVDGYSEKVITTGLMGLVKAIKEVSPERIINMEIHNSTMLESHPAEAAAIEEGALMNANYAAYRFVYWTWNMSGTDDRTHSHFMPDWPMTEYCTQNMIMGESNGQDIPLTFNGELVKDTAVDLYITKADGSGSIVVMGDGQEIYSEEINPTVGQDGCTGRDGSMYLYETEQPFSYFAPYAKSQKKISFTLDKDYEEIKICFKGSKAYWLEWSEIDVTLPESYSVERWWSETYYDAHINGTEPGTFLKDTSLIIIIPVDDAEVEEVYEIPITINSDVTYSTDKVNQEFNADYIGEWVDAKWELLGTDTYLLRFESARFAGQVREYTGRYYSDLLSVLESRQIGWLNNDFHTITQGIGGSYAGSELVEYGNYTAFDVELIKILQQYQ